MIYKLITNDNEMDELLEDLSKFELWAVDTETTGLSVRKDVVTDIAFCNGVTAYNIVHKVYDNNDFVTYVSHDKCIEALSKLQKLRTHNGSYDSRIIYHYFGVNLIEKIYEDSMLAAHTNDENLFNYGLKELGVSVFGASSVDEKKEMLESIKLVGGGDKEYYKADYKIRAKYAMKDVELTWGLCEHYAQLLKAQDLYTFFQEEPMELYRQVTVYMELYGVPVDVPLLQQSLGEINVDIKSIADSIYSQIEPMLEPFNKWYLAKEHPFQLSGSSLKELAKLIAPEDWPKTKSGHTFAAKKIEPFKDTNLFKYYSGELRVPEELKLKVQYALYAASGTERMFNLLSKHHLKKLFFEILKEIPISKTDKGNPQVDDDTLEAFSAKYAWVKELQTYNKLIKIRGTYIERFLEEQEDGIFYPRYLQHKTTSGRYSGDLQQLPKLKEEGEDVEAVVRKYNDRIRNFFVSGEGHSFIDADYSSLEVVVFADDAQDQALMDIIVNKYDLYSQGAINVFNLPEYSADKKAPNFLKNARPELRQQAKAFMLGIRYGLGSYKLHKDLGISQMQAESIIRNYFVAYPKLKLRMDEIIKSAQENGYVKSAGGRIRHLPELKLLYTKYGDTIYDGLELWKKYNEQPATYAAVKADARLASSLRNNALNFPIQSFATTIVSKASIEIAKEMRRRGLKGYICMSTHDEINLRVPNSEIEEAAKILRHKMENTTKLSVPLEAEPIIGTKYGEVK